MKVLVVGSGDIGTAVAKALHARGDDVTALKRNVSEKNSCLTYMQMDITNKESLLTLDCDYDTVLFIAAVDNRTEEAYKNLYEKGLVNILKLFAAKNSQTRFIFISSTAVYEQSAGEYVDENTDLLLESFRAKILYESEQRVLSHNRSSIVIRFSGIYGRGDTYMINKINNREPIQYAPSYYTNRIHRDDCIGFIVFIMQKQYLKKNQYRLYNATQNRAIPLYQYAQIISRQNNLPEPIKKILDLQSGEQGKQISNSRVVSSGYIFQHSFEV